MFTSRVVIQKIDPLAKHVRLYQNFHLRSSWTFETRGQAPSHGSNPAVFPFCFGEQEAFTESSAGSETKLQVAQDGRLLFADDYGVPEGFLIGVLFPREYVPEVFKFKTKPSIPTGIRVEHGSMSPPGYFEVKYNPTVRTSAVVFLTTQTTYFGFKCAARRELGDFPDGGDHPFMSDLYATLGFRETYPLHVTPEELSSLGAAFAPTANLDDVANAINRLSDICVQNQISKVPEAHRLSTRIQSALSNTASLVQLSDSYLSHGTVGTVAAILSRLVAYLAL